MTHEQELAATCASVQDEGVGQLLRLTAQVIGGVNFSADAIMRLHGAGSA